MPAPIPVDDDHGGEGDDASDEKEIHVKYGNKTKESIKTTLSPVKKSG